MSHSTSRTYSKWYDSFHVFLALDRWSDEDRAALYIEKMEDEFERLRAADMMASHCILSNWEFFNAALNPPTDGLTAFDFYTRWAVKGTDAMESALKNFWRERV